MRVGAVRDEVLQWVEEEGKAGCFADPTASAKGCWEGRPASESLRPAVPNLCDAGDRCPCESNV